jgi:hypothetical protein
MRLVMNEIKKREHELMVSLCEENNLNIELVKKLLKEAEKFSYETKTSGARKKEYLNLITYYNKQNKGDQ